MHARHDQRIAFLFKLNSLETKLQRMLVLERHNALGRLRHGDGMSQSTFGLRPSHTHTHCYSPLDVPENTKMFQEPKKYMRGRTRISYCHVATWDTHYMHMFYFVC